MKDSNFLKENNARQMWHPMGHPGQLQKNTPTIITGASGSSITDIDGNTVVDAVGGLWCVNVGYSSTAIKQAIAAQLDALPYYSAFAGTSNDAAIELSYELTQFFEPEGMVRSFFTSGGSDSVETTLRLARQYHKIRGDKARTKYFSLKKGYHGTHFGGASVNGNPRFRTAYEPLLAGCHHMPAPYTYRNPFNETDPQKLAQLCLQATEDEILFQDPSTIAAFIMEPILGAGGVIVPHESFMPGIRALCDKYGILLIADEVITGFGRVGEWSGSRLWGVQPDMMSMAKGITSGYFPFGVAMLNQKIADVFEQDETGAGSIGHGYTYSAHPVGAAAALACLAESKRLDLPTLAAARGTQIYDGMLGLKEKYDLIGDVRGGRGLMTGVEFVSDPTTKAPLGADRMAKMHAAIYEAGVMVRLGGNNVLMSPPLVITEAEIDAIIAALDHGLSVIS
jgi:adenosylmethionine-8-amino-7-oxononanoate aminotransferase